MDCHLQFWLIGNNGESTSIVFVFLKITTHLILRNTGALFRADRMALISYEFTQMYVTLSKDQTELVAYGIIKRYVEEGSLSQA